MIVIGIVGRIGSGKSTVAGLLAGHGARVIDADRIAHGVLAEPEVIGEVAARFGPEVVVDDAGGHRIDRKRLAATVFGATPDHAAALGDLEAIVHPRVHDRIAAVLDEARRSREAVVVLDVPLLVQAGWADGCDVVLVLECDDAVRRARIAGRFSTEQIAAREAAWSRPTVHRVPPGKIRTVDTSGDPSYTRLQVERIWSALRGGNDS